MIKKNNKNSGFTLIDLLLMIVIIIILIIFAKTIIKQRYIKVSDTQRIQNINQLSKGILIYGAGEKTYPLAEIELVSSNEQGDWNEFLKIIGEREGIKDPINNSDFSYYYSANEQNEKIRCNGKTVKEVGFILGYRSQFAINETFGKLTGVGKCDQAEINCYCLAESL